ncbi:TonB-dependent receptor [Acidipila sp. EB88]|uniref:TonB-dependent receptor n=1 Tax=Acidipila sp. EB88 TaxID=2305226 RepID=UPI000F601BFD|nr:TonB-dependent receptor [Acidipila sp. EB88]RRA47597.1 hypothetical protein D1Y84_04115 [Acidipila sp. EB88]
MHARNSAKDLVTFTLVLAAATFCEHAQAQAPCHGSNVQGEIHDSSGLVIAGAALSLETGESSTSNEQGKFTFPCVPSGTHQVHITAQGFADATIAVEAPARTTLAVMMQVAAVQTDVQVSDVGAQAPDAAITSGAEHTLTQKDLASLADDPDDLKRELQQLAASAGASPASTVITVDGFQNETQLPPKSSIEYIKVNPDMYSAEYREPPFEGGRVEVYTKPGQSAYHGALFTTNGSSWMNARNPFSVSKGALGKQRYGFELSGPVRKQGSDFALTLEHREIDDTAVVNAVTLDPAGNQLNTVNSVPIPQALWLATARLGWQLGDHNTFVAAYSGNTNHLENLGVGGTSLAEAGYTSDTYEHQLKLSNITLASAKLMHEARVSLDWQGESDSPLSAAPQVQVAGAFTGGGAALGAQRLHELTTEVDDDAVLSTSKHLLKIGVQFRNTAVHDQLTQNFNGSYTFGGGTAPVLNAQGQPVAAQTETISGLEQYRRALLGLPGGAATAFTNVAGNPSVSFNQTRAALYVQDSWKLRSNVQVAMGFRYYLQNKPSVYSGATPRLGVAWTPDKKATWQLHAHVGLFTGQYGYDDEQELLRMDGVQRVTSTVYNPDFNNPLGGGATIIHSLRTVNPRLANINFSIANGGGSHDFPHGWTVAMDYYQARLWNAPRTQNVNSPLNNDPAGPRPGTPDLNVLQLNNSAQGSANVEFFSVSQHAMKRFNFFAGGVRVNLVDDNDDSEFFTPQSSRTDAGEFAHRSGQGVWQLFGNGSLTVPGEVAFSTDIHAASGAHYNITTGFDNNGDGNFNDRPQYATAGDTNAFATRYGSLVSSGGIGVFPRNAARLPWTVYMDVNAQRAFKISHHKVDPQQTLTVNVRSSNLLNHTNVTAQGGVLGSPLFGQSYGADNSRRVEAGVRYSF